MRKWKCTVCGYVHTGNEPPEKCPVCGADRSQFIEVTEEKPIPPPKAAEKEPIPQAVPKSSLEPFDILSRWIYKFHIHPMSVHIPNGLLPVSVFFAFLAVLFAFTPLATASYFNLIFVLCTMPAVLYSGYSDWKSRFKGAFTRVFKIKMACGGTVTLTALILVLWRTADPMILGQPSAGRWLFLLIHLIMLAAATAAGYYGGKLVFKDKR
jgi:uncharacterized membrane protein